MKNIPSYQAGIATSWFRLGDNTDRIALTEGIRKLFIAKFGTDVTGVRGNSLDVTYNSEYHAMMFKIRADALSRADVLCFMKEVSEQLYDNIKSVLIIKESGISYGGGTPFDVGASLAVMDPGRLKSTQPVITTDLHDEQCREHRIYPSQDSIPERGLSAIVTRSPKDAPV